MEAGGVVGLKSCIQNSAGLANFSKWSPRIAQFNCDVVQVKPFSLTKGNIPTSWSSVEQVWGKPCSAFPSETAVEGQQE